MNPRHNYRHYLLCPGAAIMIIGLLGHRVAFERKIVAAEAGRGGVLWMSCRRSLAHLRLVVVSLDVTSPSGLHSALVTLIFVFCVAPEKCICMRLRARPLLRAYAAEGEF
jgi:hypothetical protein